MDQRLQANRFEFKYIVSDAKARAIRDYARSYLQHDEFADPQLDYSYPIHSVYLDNAGLSLCQATVNGLKNRFKLRIRYYDGNADHPVYFEIKRRVNDAILKSRAAVRRECAAPLLAGHWPRMSDLQKPDDLRHWDALQQFCDLRDRLNGRGQLIVSYLREAWVLRDNNSVRLTFDRSLTATPWTGHIIAPDFKTGRHPDVGGVILELKFTDRFPNWMRELAQVFGLRRCSVPKYVECASVLNMTALTEVDPRG